MDTLADLTAAVANWLHRTDLTPRIPDFIQLAETRINRVMAPRMEEVEVLLFSTLGSGNLPLPQDYNAPVSLWLEAWQPSRLLTQLPAVNFQVQEGLGFPIAWTVKDNRIQLNRIPTEVSQFRLRYQKKFKLVSPGDTNYVLKNYPDVYLYGALTHSAPFLRDDQRALVWKTLWDEALLEAQHQESLSKSKGVLVTDPALRSERTWNIIEG